MDKIPRLPTRHRMIPNEIWLHVFSFTSSKALHKCRLVSKKFKTMANIVLAQRLQEPLNSLMEKSKSLISQQKQLVAVKSPQLSHYQQFMVQALQSDISEVVWFNNPPAELRTVCECLVRLNDPSLNEFPHRISWFLLKKIMGKYEFKTWYINLRTTCKQTDKHSVALVENIIRMDPLITYERLRIVSMAGYRILIQIAAILQYCTIQNELDAIASELKSVQSVLNKTAKFMNALTI